MALTAGLFEALKDALKIHSASEESDHSLDYSRTCSTTLDNPVITALVQKKSSLYQKFDALSRE